MLPPFNTDNFLYVDELCHPVDNLIRFGLKPFKKIAESVGNCLSLIMWAYIRYDGIIIVIIHGT